MSRSPFIRRVTLRNYKSIAACRVALDRLTFLVGPNGAGKSNFLDALRFVADSLRTSIDHALRERGTIGAVRRSSGGHPTHFALRLDFVLPSGQAGHYAFRVGARPNGGFEVQDEECEIASGVALSAPHRFHVRRGTIAESTITPLPAAIADRLFLVAASGTPAFRPVYDALSRIEIYNLDPRAVGAMQQPDPGDLLRRDGSNAASVYQGLPSEARAELCADLGRIVPGISGAEIRTLGAQETIEFRQGVRGQRHPWRFLAGLMSDGTLRAFGVLLAIHQAKRAGPGQSPLLVGIEEPELALHPGAAAVLLAALRRGAQETQIVVTSHSPDLLDNPDIAVDSVLAVAAAGGVTRIGGIDEAGRSVLRDGLFTVGELLRLNQIEPDAGAIDDVEDERSLTLFDRA